MFSLLLRNDSPESERLLSDRTIIVDLSFKAVLKMKKIEVIPLDMSDFTWRVHC